MKKALVLFILLYLLCSISRVYAADTSVTTRRTLSAVGASDVLQPLGSQGLRYHEMSWTVYGGTFSACSLDLEGTLDGVTWFNIIANQDCSSSSSSSVVNSLARQTRLYINTYTIATGTPKIDVTHVGSWDNPVTAGASTMQGIVNIPGSTYADGTTQTARLAADASIVVYAQGLVGTANPTYADQAIKPLSMDTNGSLRATVTNISSDIDEGSVVTSQAPITVGVQAVADDKAAVDAGDSVRLVSTLNGKLITVPIAPPELWYTTSSTSTTSTSDVDFLAADATYKHCLTSISVINTSATATTLLLYEDGSSAGTLRYVFAAGADYGGHVQSFPTPLCTSAVNKKWTIKAAAGVSTIYFNYTGYKAK